MSTGPGGQRAQVVVGGGFAGFYALRYLQRHLPPDGADLVLVNPTDYLLYSPLLPEVATGVIEARHIAVSLRRALPRVRLVLGRVSDIDLAGHTVTVQTLGLGTPVTRVTLEWDRLALTPGSVTRQLPIPGVAEHGRALKTLVEAVFLRGHLLEQLDLADAQPDTQAGRAERSALLTVVAVGAGYTGTELVAQTQRWLRTIERRWSRTGADAVRWVLVDAAPMVLPELGPDLGRGRALALPRRRGVDVRLQVSVESADEHAVRLSDGTAVATRTLVWGAGVVANPLIGSLERASSPVQGPGPAVRELLDSRGACLRCPRPGRSPGTGLSSSGLHQPSPHRRCGAPRAGRRPGRRPASEERVPHRGACR